MSAPDTVMVLAVSAGKAGHVADIADDGGSDDGADPDQPGQAGPGRGHDDRELVLGVTQLSVDAAQVL